MKKTFASLAAALILAGCVVAPSPILDSPSSVASQVTAKGSEFDNFRTYSAPPIMSSFPRPGGMFQATDDVRATLSVLRPKKESDRTIFAMSTRIEYEGSWRFYSSASLQGGAIVPASSATRNVRRCTGGALGGCSYTESLVFDLPLSLLLARTGFAVRINARQGGGDFTINVPAAYVNGLIQAASTK